jgi:poly(hydroxyalkanoate) granule-associated protein
MVKKLKKIAEKQVAQASKLLGDNPLAHNVREQAQHIWLAGMGAFSEAQEKGGKAFEALINEGLKLQKKTQGIAEEKISEVTGKMSAVAGEVQARAGQNWDKLESIFEARTAKAMNKLGVPTAKDVQALIKRVDELSAAVAKLNKASRPAARAPAKAPVKAATKAVSKTMKSGVRKTTTAAKRVVRRAA